MNDDLTRDLELRDVSPLEQVAAFTSIIANPTDILEVRAKHRQTGKMRQTWLTPAELSAKLPQFERWNRDHDVYIGANPRREYGLAGDVNVSIARCLFADCDPANGFTSISEFSELIERKGLPEPSALVNSGHGAWGFWRLQNPMPDLAVWKQLQSRLSILLGTDTSACNPERLTRLPGFTNHKPPEALAWLHTVNPTRVYPLSTLTEVLPAMPPVTSTRPVPIVTSGHEELLKRARLYVAVPKGVGEGSRNSVIFRLAGHLASFVDEHRQCLAESEIVNTIHTFNDRCTPSLPDDEVLKIVQSSLIHGKAREPKLPRKKFDRSNHAMAFALVRENSDA